MVWEAVATTLGLGTTGGGGRAAPTAGGSGGAVGTTGRKKKENKNKIKYVFQIYVQKIYSKSIQNLFNFITKNPPIKSSQILKTLIP